ncbi:MULTISPECIES: hypothetical protein [unclassified Peribacillus]|uniref:hypothetical protein n=1 Tax=unclassified Peribacillus TaxID=2675266 RepID=UPI001914049C|nr:MULTISPECIES: hypothetical protein [unclassified Peribacillus]MBK5444174.1 hypothetical protein [Peribacillus sp. TH24]WMX55652.1 hypothetical protein RE409_27190 [Peribacillus sp. R9-11]
MAKKPSDKVKELLQKAEQIKEDYAEGKVKAQEELEALKEEHAEQQEHTKATHKLYILNKLTSDSYNVEKKNLEVITEKVRDAEAKISLVDQYEIEDLKKVREEIREVGPEFSKERREFQELLQKQIAEAKTMYLQVVLDASKNYKESNLPYVGIAELERSIGIDRTTHHLAGGSLDNFLGVWSSLDATITDENIKKAYYGKI